MDTQVRTGRYEGFMELCPAGQPCPCQGLEALSYVSSTMFTTLHSSSLNPHSYRKRRLQHANLINDELTQVTLCDLPKITQNK